MWKYTRERTGVGVLKDSIITNAYLRHMMQNCEERKGDFTEEAIEYIREIMRPFIVRLNAMDYDVTDILQAIIDYNEFTQTIPHYNIPIREVTRKNLIGYDDRRRIFDNILELFLWDEEVQDTLYNDDPVMTPWSIWSYINEHEVRRNFFHPPPIMVTVSLSGSQTQLAMTRNQVLGVMAVYRYLHRDHPLTMFMFPLKHEMDEVNYLALDQREVDYEDWYNVTVGTDVYSFEHIDFFQGLLTGAQWTRTDPQTFITSLKQWKEERFPPEYISRDPYDIIDIFRSQGPRKYAIDLQY